LVVDDDVHHSLECERVRFAHSSYTVSAPRATGRYRLSKWVKV
jgi:hypothetical protein